MIVDASVYLIVFGITACMAFLFQSFFNISIINSQSLSSRKIDTFTYCVLGCLFLLPVIAMLGLRYGIGADYYNYEDIFNVLHNSSLEVYFNLHNSASADVYYVEFGYYILNVLFPSFRVLLWGVGVLAFSLVLFAIKDYTEIISFPIAIFIYLCTQFVYLMNGMRFALAIVFVLAGYVYLSKNKTVAFCIMILLAALFHKSSLICFAMIFLKQFKIKGMNLIRNISLFILIILFPLISQYLMRIVAYIPFFKRYFSETVYSVSDSSSFSFVWIFHIVPVLVPLLLLCKHEIFDSEDTTFFFRICIMEIPFRMLGLLNTYYTRLTRLSQIAYVVFIPLVLSKLNNKKVRVLLYFYYIVWFIFYFIYYAIVNDGGDSLPYVWIF